MTSDVQKIVMSVLTVIAINSSLQEIITVGCVKIEFFLLKMDG